MTELLALAPMHVEALALRRCDRVLRTGMGQARARVAAARAQAIEATAVVVAGICGGVSPELATGDLICPSEVRLADGTSLPIPVSDALASFLRARGLRVHGGPILSLDHIAHARERAALLDTGILAVDMETAWLVEAAAGRPFGVVRAVADSSGRHVFDPRFAGDAFRGLASLQRAVPALQAWARSAASVATAAAATDRLAVA